MDLLNQVGQDTRWGYRTLQLHRGDLTQLPEMVDVLVLSTFQGSYEPVPGTVVAALQDNTGVEVAACAADPAYDLRQPFGTWVSQPFDGCCFRRLLVVELQPYGTTGQPMSEANALLQNVFVTLSAIEAKGVPVGTVAMPALGTGRQQLDVEGVVAGLLREAPRFLDRSPTAEHVLFVEINEGRAAALNAAMNRVLKRASTTLPQTEIVRAVQREVAALAARMDAESPDPLLEDVATVFARDHVRSFEVGVLGRRLAERVANDLGTSSRGDLAGRIMKLADHGVASWIRSYLHVLRIFGNESAHEQGARTRTPTHVEAGDVAIGLFCLQRLLEFWAEHRHAPAPAIG